MMRRAAVLPALGIGDALLMMIASHQLQSWGDRVVTFHDELPQLSPWFPGHTLLVKKEFSPADFDLIIAENDNSTFIKQLIQTCRSSSTAPLLSLYYPSYSSQKHQPLDPTDFVFHSHLSMADNIALAIATFLKNPIPIKHNGITPPPSYTHKKYPHRVIIHPTSRVAKKNWSEKRFLQLAQRLQQHGYSPLFCVSPSERIRWQTACGSQFPLADCPTLDHLAGLIYESASVIGNDSLLCHLGSNLGLPTLVIAEDRKQMQLWRPGWTEAKLVFPPKWLPNMKGLRLRERHWQKFISSHHVLKKFAAIQASQPLVSTETDCLIS